MSDTFRILYLGPNHGTSRHRAEALRRLGHYVEVIDPYNYLPNGQLTKKVVGKFIQEVGSDLIESYICFRLVRDLKGKNFDLALVTQGELFGSVTLGRIREFAPIIVNYINDDPFSFRDKRRFSLYRRAVSLYDLVVVVRQENFNEAYANGAQKVLRVYMSADEIVHKPFPMSVEDRAHLKSEVAFIGTWMPERGFFLAKLVREGVPLSIWGDRWHKAHEWSVLRKCWRGNGAYDITYTKIIQNAKVCLGLLSKGNRDQHTCRSIEIPYIGSVLCAQRTEEHLSMYQEAKEALFWSTPEECAEKCFWLLNNPVQREQIAKAGQKRCRGNGFLNEPVMKTIMNNVLGRAPVNVSSTKRIMSAKRLCVQ